MKTIICIVGKTGTGKDTIAKYLYNKYGIDAICSYTTREKRDYETDGKNRNKEEADRCRVATSHRWRDCPFHVYMELQSAWRRSKLFKEKTLRMERGKERLSL